MWIPDRIISGGQAGADIGGLVGAERCGIKTGGTAPKNFKTEVGPQPILKSRFGLIEHASTRYEGRTRENIISSNAVLIFATRPGSAGTKLTIRICEDEKMPWVLVDPKSATAMRYSMCVYSSKEYDRIFSISQVTVNQSRRV